MNELFWPTTWWEWGLVTCCVVLVLLPPKFDLAIRLKERTERKSHEQE